MELDFISEKDNIDDILMRIEHRSRQIQQQSLNNDKQTRITDYEKYESDIYYGGSDQPSSDSTVPTLPHLILVFNSQRRILKLPGFPSLMKEVAEIIEAGNISETNYRSIEFIQSMERYASVE